jgi:hypothetical protein
MAAPDQLEVQRSIKIDAPLLRVSLPGRCRVFSNRTSGYVPLLTVIFPQAQHNPRSIACISHHQFAGKKLSFTTITIALYTYFTGASDLYCSQYIKKA